MLFAAGMLKCNHAFSYITYFWTNILKVILLIFQLINDFNKDKQMLGNKTFLHIFALYQTWNTNGKVHFNNVRNRLYFSLNFIEILAMPRWPNVFWAIWFSRTRRDELTTARSYNKNIPLLFTYYIPISLMVMSKYTPNFKLLRPQKIE